MSGFRSPRVLGTLIALVVLAGCAAPAAAPKTGGAPGDQALGQGPAKRLVTIVETREPTSLEPSLQPQNREWSALASGFMARFVPGSNAPAPYLAEELPAVDKGTWKVLPDGRMETTYTIKPK